MKVSFWLPNSLSWADTTAAARSAVDVGASGLWLADHFMPNAPEPADGPFGEAFTMLAALAVVEPSVQIGTMVAGNTYRNPAVLLKQAVTIDHISGGRFVLGIGAGWQENEHRADGLAYESFRWRFDRLEESLEVITTLQRQHRTTFDGEHVTMRDAPLDPKPVHGNIPLLIGGKGPNRSLPLVARYADVWNMWGTPEMMAASGAVLDQRCEAVGRDPGEIHRTAAVMVQATTDPTRVAELAATDRGRPTIVGTPEQLTQAVIAYRTAGVAELVVPGHLYGSPTEIADQLGLLLDAVTSAA